MRNRSTLFGALQSHYVFEDGYGCPGKGNDKGKVEGMVGYARQTFMVLYPRAHDAVALNALFEDRCRARQSKTLRGNCADTHSQAPSKPNADCLSDKEGSGTADTNTSGVSL